MIFNLNAKKKVCLGIWPKVFDGSCPISETFDKSNYDLGNLNFSLKINDNQVQQGNTSDMIFNIDYIVSYVSQYFTLRNGDIILTGTPEGVGPVKVGDKLEAFLENEKVLNFEVK